jgi:hypothetical protein
MIKSILNSTGLAQKRLQKIDIQVSCKDCCEYYFSKRLSMSKLSIVKEFLLFLKVRKKWWLAPIIIFLFLLGALIIFTEGSAVAPFIYTLF